MRWRVVIIMSLLSLFALTVVIVIGFCGIRYLHTVLLAG